MSIPISQFIPPSFPPLVKEPFKLLKIIEDPNSFCLYDFTVVTIKTKKNYKYFLLIHLKITTINLLDANINNMLL